MPMLNEEQISGAVEVASQYVVAKDEDGNSLLERSQANDRIRRDVTETKLGPLIKSYLGGSTDVATFKSTVDGLNKRFPLWGFMGIKGQMFFNQLAKRMPRSIFRRRERSSIAYFKKCWSPTKRG